MTTLLLGAAFLLATARLGTAAAQEFHLVRPEAQSVAVVGEFNQWHSQPMAKKADGTWSLTIPIPPGTYGYKFLVNGTEWLLDPENSNRKTVDGIENSAVEVGGAASAAPSPLVPAPALPTSTAEALKPTPGELFETDAPMTATTHAMAMRAGNPRLTATHLALAVPPGFDPAKSWPILVINNTENYANIDSLREFKDAANAAGWIALAGDPVAAEKDEHGDWREPCSVGALDTLAAAWQGAQKWPVVCGGMSGGAKNSAFVAAAVAKAHYHLVGMLMMGCNQDMASVALRKSSPPQFLGVPVFLSSGKADTIATPSMTDYVKESLRRRGFRRVRLESHDGAHVVYQPHIGEALNWFLEVASGGKKSPTPSALDSFFKK
ncbi:MAG: hypothetical protein ACR2MW_01280 [Chthoniobacterales bacterium]